MLRSIPALFVGLLQSRGSLKHVAAGEGDEVIVARDDFQAAIPQSAEDQGVAAAFSETFGALPPAVVVRGRQGPNSNINGVYIRDYTWHGQIDPCYRRGGGTNNQRNIFLYFAVEWRMGPSPEEETVWAYARSTVRSPLLIDATWEVWDGRRVVADPQLRVSDTSVIPSVIFLSFAGDGGSNAIPAAQRSMEGMLLQQPGLWDGRPYYRHQVAEVFLLCSVAEGRWRLGPLPRGSGSSGVEGDAVLYARSAAAVPQEIEASWQIPMPPGGGGDVKLPEGAVRLATTSNFGSVQAAAAGPLVLGEGAVNLATTSLPGSGIIAATPIAGHAPHPKHIVVEGVAVWGGIANGVYRRASEPMHQRPVYHKTDAHNAASLWFAGGDWLLGPAAGGDQAWAYAPSSALSPLAIDARWRRLDRGSLEETVQLSDATNVISDSLVVAGDRFEQQFRLCDARPVYRRVGAPRANDVVADTALGSDVYLFFRAYEGEWCLGPVVGGVECYARSAGSHLQVVPDPASLVWYPAAGALAHGKDGLHWLERHAFLVIAALSCAALCSILAVVCVVGRSLWRSACTSAIQAKCDPTQSSAMPPCGVDIKKGDSEAPCTWRDDVSSTSISSRSVSSASSSSRSRSKRRSLVSCVVCFEAPREILLEPCRHVCCCKACADRLDHCPMCRAPKVSLTEVFLFREHSKK